MRAVSQSLTNLTDRAIAVAANVEAMPTRLDIVDEGDYLAPTAVVADASQAPPLPDKIATMAGLTLQAPDIVYETPSISDHLYETPAESAGISYPQGDTIPVFNPGNMVDEGDYEVYGN